MTVDILRGFPSFHGQEPRARLAEFALGSLVLMSATQIYPVFLAAPFMLLPRWAPVAEPAARPAVTVHETVERHGVQLQLISAESTPALDLHLRELGVEFPRERLAAGFVSRPLLLRACGFLLFVGLAVLAAQCAYTTWPKHARPSRTAVSAIGLANTLTVIGALVATVLVARHLGVAAGRAVWFATLNSLTFCVLLGVLVALIAGLA